MSKPHVALIGSNGYLGQEFVPVFANAANEGQFASLRIFTGSKPKEAVTSLASDKVTISQINYSVKEELESSLKGIDVLVSTLGTRGTEVVEKNLIHAAVATGVKVYFPSEWGTDLEISPYTSPLLAGKTKHAEEAREAGLKTVVSVVGCFSELILSPVLGFWAPPNTLNIAGAGSQRVAFTSRKHIAQYALRAVIVAFEDPQNFPDKIRVWDHNGTWDDYAKAFDEVLGAATSKNYITRDQLQKNFDTEPSIGELVNLLIADGLYDYTENHNELLNPGQKYFKRQTIVEQVKEATLQAAAH